MEFTEIQCDAVTELLNIGMGAAANSLSQMVGQEVLLAVPYVDFLSRNEAADVIAEEAGARITAVKQDFSGPFSGSSLLVFPEKNSLELVRTLMQDAIPLEDLSEMEQEAMNEVGNVILNACLGSLANMFGTQIETGLPDFKQGPCAEVFGTELPHIHSDEAVMFLRMEFSLMEKNISGFITFLMDIKSMQAFQTNIDEFLGAA